MTRFGRLDRSLVDKVATSLAAMPEPEERVLHTWAWMANHWERAVAQAPADLGRPIACRKGCHFCCRIQVDIGWTEAAVIAAQILAERPDLEGAVRAEAAARVGPDGRRLGPAETFGRWCPLLVDGACSIYEHRPLICRAYNSLDVEACAGASEDMVPSVEQLGLVGVAYAVALELVNEHRPAEAPPAGELAAMVTSEIDRQKAAMQRDAADLTTSTAAVEP